MWKLQRRHQQLCWASGPVQWHASASHVGSWPAHWKAWSTHYLSYMGCSPRRQPCGSPQHAGLLGRAHLSNYVAQEVAWLPEPRGSLQLRRATAHLSNPAALLSQHPIGLPVLLLHAGVCLPPHLLQALLMGFLLLGQLEVKVRRSL